MLHLHLCVADTFHDKDQYLTPEAWVQAPDDQHIVINENETNTTLNTPGLWLMCPDNGPDVVSKGFWVMPPPNNHDMPMVAAPTKVEPPPAVVVVPTYDHVNTAAVPNDSIQDTSYSNDNVELKKYVQIDNKLYLVNDMKKTKSTADENKRKRGRPKDVNKSKAKQHIYTASSNSYTSGTSNNNSVIQTSPSTTQNKMLYLNNEIDVMAVNNKPSTSAADAKRKVQNTVLHQSHQISAPPHHVIQHTKVQQQHQQIMPQQPHSNVSPQQVYYVDPANLPVDNYIISFDDNSTPQVITPDDNLYEQISYSVKNEPMVSPILTSNNIPMPAPIKTVKREKTEQDSRAQASCPFDDLSHLDKPISETTSFSGSVKLKARNDYIDSYCSFLKSRTTASK